MMDSLLLNYTEQPPIPPPNATACRGCPPLLRTLCLQLRRLQCREDGPHYRTLPDDRPTFNLIQACTDTLVSRLTQGEPAPKFLTDGADYKQRHLAQRLNQFILGEFYQTKAYQKGARMLRDGIVMGPGALWVWAAMTTKCKLTAFSAQISMLTRTIR